MNEEKPCYICGEGSVGYANVVNFKGTQITIRLCLEHGEPLLTPDGKRMFGLMQRQMELKRRVEYTHETYFKKTEGGK